ncbi:MAG: 50S ribosomal protein L24 [Opitutales bacterium]
MGNKLKKGDEVVVIAGDHKGSKGKILEMIREKNRVIVEGVNMIKKHEKKTQDNPQGAIVEREASLHFSNVSSGQNPEKSENYIVLVQTPIVDQ